MPRWRDR